MFYENGTLNGESVIYRDDQMSALRLFYQNVQLHTFGCLFPLLI